MLIAPLFSGRCPAQRSGLLSGRFPCGDRDGPEGGRKAAGLPLLQRTEQCSGDGVRRKQAGYFLVRDNQKLSSI